MSDDDPLESIRHRLRCFVAERDWEQFHSPKNLAMALIVEAAELVEPFQWLSEEQSRNLDAATREQVEQELADVFIYLLRLSEQLDCDLLAAAQRKMDGNERKYPAHKVRGRADKYTKYEA